MTFNPYDYSSPYPEQQPGFPNMPPSMTPLQPYTAPMPVVEGGHWQACRTRRLQC